MKPTVIDQRNNSNTQDAGNTPRAPGCGKAGYSPPQLFELGAARDLTRGGIKEWNNDSWNNNGFYV